VSAAWSRISEEKRQRVHILAQVIHTCAVHTQRLPLPSVDRPKLTTTSSAPPADPGTSSSVCSEPPANATALSRTKVCGATALAIHPTTTQNIIHTMHPPHYEAPHTPPRASSQSDRQHGRRPARGSTRGYTTCTRTESFWLAGVAWSFAISLHHPRDHQQPTICRVPNRCPAKGGAYDGSGTHTVHQHTHSHAAHTLVHH
jgi:hypothetical protein